MTAQSDQIHAATERARPLLPDLPSNYADVAIASGRNLDQVKGDLVDRMSARSPREISMANMKRQLRASGELPDQAGISAEGATKSRENMIAQLKRDGMEPVARRG